MGTLDKIYLQFDQVFWDEEPHSILTPFTDYEPGYYNNWINLYALFGELTAIGVGVCSTAAWIYGSQNRRLVAPDLSDETIRHIRQESYIEPTIYLLAIGAGWLVSWDWSMTVTLGFPIAFLIQSTLASPANGEN